jgi:hypothetical protein
VRRHFIGFFVIALVAEVLTTWAQKLRTVSDVEPGLYYPSFRAMMLERLLIWTVTILGLTAIWSIILRCASKGKRQNPKAIDL